MRKRGQAGPARHGKRIPNGLVGMPEAACDIAVSEMTSTPLSEICSWVLVTLRHRGDHHELGLLSALTADSLVTVLETALADARHVAEQEASR